MSSTKAEQIIAAATRLFLDNGFDGASMDDIATAAGASKQTVYSHFGSKEELFSQVIATRCNAHQLNDELFDQQRPVREVLWELAEHLTELLLSDEAIRMFRLCVAETPQREKIAPLYWQAGPAQLKQRLEHYLSSKQQTGQIRPVDPAIPTQQFIALIRSEAYIKKLLSLPGQPSQEYIRNYLHSSIDLFANTYLIEPKD